MGNYTIIIEGHGLCMNNGDPKDADQIARETMRTLLAMGHTEVKGIFVYDHHGVSDPEGRRGSTTHLEPVPAAVPMQEVRSKAKTSSKSASVEAVNPPS